MSKIKLTLEYDGTQFFGFQRQSRQRAVQEVLERALSKVLKKRVKVVAAGRTDSGVHAEGQVAHFQTLSRMTPQQMVQALNSVLPDDVAVVRAERVREAFHARFSAKTKVYRYQIWNSPARSPLNRRFVHAVFRPLDVRAIRKAARLLVGKHDFASFQAAGSSQKGGTVRTIRRLRITQTGPLITLLIEADGFLYNMVRNIVGTLLLVGAHRLTTTQFRQIFQACDRRQAGPTAPACGLTLVKVCY